MFITTPAFRDCPHNYLHYTIIRTHRIATFPADLELLNTLIEHLSIIVCQKALNLHDFTLLKPTTPLFKVFKRAFYLPTPRFSNPRSPSPVSGLLPVLRRQPPMDESFLLNDKGFPSPSVVLVESPGDGIGVKAEDPSRTKVRRVAFDGNVDLLVPDSRWCMRQENVLLERDCPHSIRRYGHRLLSVFISAGQERGGEWHRRKSRSHGRKRSSPPQIRRRSGAGTRPVPSAPRGAPRRRESAPP